MLSEVGKRCGFVALYVYEGNCPVNNTATAANMTTAAPVNMSNMNEPSGSPPSLPPGRRTGPTPKVFIDVGGLVQVVVAPQSSHPP